MKLAEALSKRSQLMEKVSQLKVRLNDCIKVQEGDVPAESPDSVIKELDRTLERARVVNIPYKPHKHAYRGGWADNHIPCLPCVMSGQ